MHDTILTSSETGKEAVLLEAVCLQLISTHFTVDLLPSWWFCNNFIQASNRSKNSARLYTATDVLAAHGVTLSVVGQSLPCCRISCLASLNITLVRGGMVQWPTLYMYCWVKGYRQLLNCCVQPFPPWGHPVVLYSLHSRWISQNSWNWSIFWELYHFFKFCGND